MPAKNRNFVKPTLGGKGTVWEPPKRKVKCTATDVGSHRRQTIESETGRLLQELSRETQ